MKTASKTLETRIERGSVVYVRYWDHAVHRDTDPQDFCLMLRETIGWIDYAGDESIKVVWERFSTPSRDQDATLKETGLTILKSAIVELRKIGFEP